MNKSLDENAGNGSIKKKKRSSALFIILIVLAAGVFCFAGYKLIGILGNYKQSEDSYDNIRDVVQETGTNAYAQSDPDAIDYEPFDYDLSNRAGIEYEDEYDEGITYDYKALLAINPDTIGYIKARGEGKIVDYPVVQAKDNDYYMDHLFDRTVNAAGSIFMDFNCIRRFSSEYSILYGHNMASGSRMFGYLKQYENEQYHNSHLEYDIFTPYAHYVYKVIAAYKSDTNDLAYSAPVLFNYGSMSPESRIAGLKELAEHAISLGKYRTGYDVNEIGKRSHFIALSTCYGDYSDPSRFIVLLSRDRIVIPRPETEKTSK
ncbi:MAG: class B sortase [Lachnospiraceae bacterium]|nr:class B sortase [Lachnospiraceae bacterium]